MRKVPVLVYFKDIESLKNGTFYRKSSGGIFQYVLGDCLREVKTVPEGLNRLGQSSAEEYLPRCFWSID